MPASSPISVEHWAIFYIIELKNSLLATGWTVQAFQRALIGRDEAVHQARLRHVRPVTCPYLASRF